MHCFVCLVLAVSVCLFACSVSFVRVLDGRARVGVDGKRSSGLDLKWYALHPALRAAGWVSSEVFVTFVCDLKGWLSEDVK